MPNKKTEVPVGHDTQASPEQAQQHLNQLYAAHQVHALCQLLYLRLAGSARQTSGWNAQAGWNPQGQTPAWPSAGSPVSTYWYA